MIYPSVGSGNKSALVFQDVPEMEGLDFCLRYFDDESVMFMSPSMRKRVDSGEKFERPYFILSYRKQDKPIAEIVTEMKEEIEKLPGKKLVVDNQSLPVNNDVGRVMVSPLFG